MHTISIQPMNRHAAFAALRMIRPRVQAASDNYADVLERNLTQASELRPSVSRLVDDFNTDIIEAAQLPPASGGGLLHPIMPVNYPVIPVVSPLAIDSSPKITA